MSRSSPKLSGCCRASASDTIAEPVIPSQTEAGHIDIIKKAAGMAAPNIELPPSGEFDNLLQKLQDPPEEDSPPEYDSVSVSGGQSHIPGSARNSRTHEYN